jgi:GAF domain-containing protein
LSDAAFVLSKIADCASCKTDRNELARVAVEAIAQKLPQASWAGVYWLEGDALVLGPFVGPPTEHTRIPVGKGVCGAAVAQDRDQVVDDVSARPDYLACSPAVRSEIVVLIRASGKVVGQLDLDSEKPAAFSRADHAFLTVVAGALGSLLDFLAQEAAEGGTAPKK